MPPVGDSASTEELMTSSLPTSSDKEEDVCSPPRLTSHCSQHFSLQNTWNCQRL